MAGVVKVVTVVPCRKPGPWQFVRTHPDTEHFWLSTCLLMSEDREPYMVDPSLWSTLDNRPMFSYVLLATAIDRRGELFLWPLKETKGSGKPNSWNQSAKVAAELAIARWVQVSSDQAAGKYQVFVAPATAAAGDPAWPDLDMAAILDMAFKDRFIEDWDDPILRKLRGEE